MGCQKIQKNFICLSIAQTLFRKSKKKKKKKKKIIFIFCQKVSGGFVSQVILFGVA